MTKNFTNNKENILECEFKSVKETLKNNHNYKEIQNAFNNLNTAFLIERDTNTLTLKKIEIEDLLRDLLIIKSLTDKLIKKRDCELEIQLNDKIQDVVEKLENRSTLDKMLDELGISEEELENEILK